MGEPSERLQQALDLAFRYLGRRDRTVAEVRRHLAARGAAPEAIDAAVAEICRQGYLDDERFARRYAEDRRALDGWGPERIERKLLAAGVGDELVAAALGAREAPDELAAAVALLRRRFTRPPTDDRERERALGLLVRKGYELDLAYDAVRALERDRAREEHRYEKSR